MVVRVPQIFGVPWWLPVGGALALVFFGRQIAELLVRGVGGAIVNTASGAVVGIGKVIGIPEVDAQKCQDALYAGNSLDASLYCPAGTYLKASVTGKVYDPTTGAEIGTAGPGVKPQIISITEAAYFSGQQTREALIGWYESWGEPVPESVYTATQTPFTPSGPVLPDKPAPDAVWDEYMGRWFDPKTGDYY